MSGLPTATRRRLLCGHPLRRRPHWRRGAGRHALGAAATALAAAVALAGCGFRGVYSLPLPGGASLGPHPYTVDVEFSDVTDLVPDSVVKVNDVTVGKVEDIRLDGWHARVTCLIRDDVRLPDNAVARVQQTSLLGEKFVQISPPADEQPRGRLSDGDVIPLSRTDRYPEVEEVLSALSLLLNGGGLQQLQTIERELNAALSGREDRIRDLLDQLHTFVGGLEEQKSEIVRALEGIDRLTATLRKQRRTIADAVDQIGPGLKVLADQRADLTRMLEELSDLGSVATRVINKSREDLLANLRALQPILDRLADAGDDLPKALELLLTFPFPRTVPNGIFGDYVNLRVTADLDLNVLLHNLLGSAPTAASGRPQAGAGDDGRGRRPSAASPAPSFPPGPGGQPIPSSSPGPGDAGDRRGQEGAGDGGLLGLLTGGLG